MQLINISLVLAASIASTVQALHAVEPNLQRRHYDNSTEPTVSTVTVSPIPVSSVPMGTGVSTVTDAVTTKVSNATLTYTMGYGSSTTVITTTVRRTETLTETKTVYATRGSGSAVASKIDGNNKAVTSASGMKAEPTTTITSRSTTTRTLTVESSNPSGGADGYPATSVAPEDGSSPTGSACGSVATVTETIRSTVTVTADASKAPSTTEDAGSGSGSGSPSATEHAGSTFSSSSLPILPTSSVPLYNNGTSTQPTKAKINCGGTGFVTKSKSKPTTLPSGNDYRRH